MKRLFLVTLLLAVAFTVVGDSISRRRLLLKQRPAAGGGSPAWYDSIAIGDTTHDQSSVDATYSQAGPIVAGQSGNCTKIRAYFQNANFDPPFKLALYDSSSNLLAQANGTALDSGTPGFMELTIASTAVTMGEIYLVAVAANGNAADIDFRRGNTTGKTFFNDVAYASKYPDPYTESFSGNGPVCVSMYIEP